MWAQHRPAHGRPRAGRRHDAADDGVDDGRVQQCSSATSRPASSPASRSIWAARSGAPRPPATAAIYTVREAMQHLGLDPRQSIAAHPGLRQCGAVRSDRLCGDTRRQGRLRVVLGRRRSEAFHVLASRRRRSALPAIDHRSIRHDRRNACQGGRLRAGKTPWPGSTRKPTC